MQLLYARLLGGDGDPAHWEMLSGYPFEMDDLQYIEDVLNGVQAHRQDIDGQIESLSSGWSTRRRARVALAILRLAAYELLYRGDIPPAASINEAVEISKKYSTDEAGGFINGILGSLQRGALKKA